jgi:hypothetical protein
LVNPNGIATGKALVNIALGAAGEAPTANNRDFSFDGMMAEVLIYNAGMDTNNFEDAIDYLHEKYFEFTPLLGDYNFDAQFDAIDYVLWRKNDSGNTAAYDNWRANFDGGEGGAGGAPFATPEPGALVLAGWAILATIGTSRTRRATADRWARSVARSRG